MGLFNEENSVRVGGALVTVRGEAGAIAARWRLRVDGYDVAEQQINSGETTLRAALPDGSDVTAYIRQSTVGSAHVTVLHAGQIVGRFPTSPPDASAPERVVPRRERSVAAR